MAYFRFTCLFVIVYILPPRYNVKLLMVRDLVLCSPTSNTMPGVQWVLNKYLLDEWLNNCSMCCRLAQSIGALKNGSDTVWMMREDFLEEMIPESILKPMQERDFWRCPII